MTAPQRFRWESLRRVFILLPFIFCAGEGVCSPVFFFPAKRQQKKIKIFLKSDLHFRGVSCLYKWGTKYETQNEKECDENVRT